MELKAISQRCFQLIFFDVKDDMLQCPCCFIVYKGSPVLTNLALFSRLSSDDLT